MDSQPPLIASYRVQLTPSFGFAETIGILDHLVRLGVSHLYLSPVAEAVPGSLHGYDVVDHTRIRADFGGDDGLVALLDAAHGVGLGVVIDHVPNHMSAVEAHLNPWWWEMLRDGPESPAARWFDVDWAGADERVIVPKLGEPLADVLAAGGIQRVRTDAGTEFRYGPLRFPAAVGSEELPIEDALARQHYQLTWWRDPRRNVRRFFTIDDLVAVRADDPDVAEVIDSIPARLADHPGFAGVRVDHVDGLADPGRYLSGLRERIGEHRWLLVEKILAVGETLPPSWPVDGTTGYEHLRVVEHAMLPTAAEGPLRDQWRRRSGDDRDFAAIEDDARREVLDGGLRPDLERLVRQLAGSGVEPDDDTVQAVVELTIGVHRYRTYLPDDGASTNELARAERRAVAARPDLAARIADVVARLRADTALARRWEQLCSPVMAKGAEDRAFYRYLPLASLCEVGGAPGQWTLPIDELHGFHAAVQVATPCTMLAGTTHDTKRSEGVRARSLALAEIADDWVAVADAWIDRHDDLVGDPTHGASDAATVDAAMALLALQTVVTAWPIDRDRLRDYLVKAAREAESYTAWTAVDDRYEQGLVRLASTVVDDVELRRDPDLAEVVDRLERPGWARSLAALTIRLTAPGVADLYQGTAAFTYTLVDPDNRVEPDWDERRALVDRARTLDGPAAWSGRDVEATKAVVITRALALRRRRPDAFGRTAGYVPLAVTGEHADAVVAFARSDGSEPVAATVVAIRTVDDWGDTAVELPAGSWSDVFVDDAQVVAGDGPVRVEWLLDRFPVALLDRS